MNYKRWGAWVAIAFALLITFGNSSMAAEGARPAASFNHDQTRFSLTGMHSNTACESCHVKGVFKGTPTSCSDCHNRGAISNTQTKSASHIPTTQDCGVCHKTQGWSPALFSHANLTQNCSTCHNNTNQMGKPSFHIETNKDCGSCHKTTAWIPAGIDHTTLNPPATGRCSDCHGKNATGKSAGHVFTTSQCDTCHKSTSAWLPTSFVHPANVAGQCNGCHTTANATNKPAKHIQTTAQCDSCHTTAGWLPTSFDHTQVSAANNCSTCHNGTNAKGVTAKHIPVTGVQCDVCHTTGGWLPTAFAHDAGQTAGKTCANCHNGTNAKGKTATHISTANYPACDTCHTTNAWKPTQFAHQNVAANANCTTCHDGKNATGRPVTGTNAHKIAPMTANTCGACHAVGAAWKPSPMNHTGATSCTSCHVISSTGNAWTTGKSGHISTAGHAQCVDCHSTSGWKPSSFSHQGVTSSTDCATGCHGVAGKQPPVAGTPTVSKVHKIAPMTNKTCGSCHTVGVAWGPGTKMNHSGLTSCSLCHAYAGNDFTPIKVNHVVTQQQCSICHTTSLWKPAFSHVGVTAATNCATAGCHNIAGQGVPVAGKPTSAALTHAVAPMSSTSCGTCHTIGTSWGPGTKMNHSGVTNCASCHAFTGNSYTPTKSGHIPIGTAQCSFCHTVGNWLPASGFNHASIGVTAATDCTKSGCHSTANGVAPKAGRPTSGAKAHTLAPMTANTCASCHFIGSAWTPATMNHTGVTNCSACHAYAGNGFTPAKANHVVTGQQCSICHTTTLWKPTFSHAGVTAATNCATAGCHNTPGQAVPVAGKPTSAALTHAVAPMSSTSCGTCHTIGTAWGPGTKMNHTGATTCSACHAYAGNGYTPAKANHVTTTLQCSTCHTTSLWKPAYSHAGVTASTNCATAGCHSVAGQAVPVAGRPSGAKAHTVAPMNSNSCATCHTIGGTWTGISMNHTGATNCKGCHVTAGNLWTVPGKANHIAIGTSQCSACHTTTAWAPASNFNHAANGITAATNCAQSGCHNQVNKVIPLAGMPNSGVNAHTVAPMTNSTCATCHAIGTAWGPGTRMNHTGVTNCSTCHAYTGNNFTIQKVGHLVTTLQCSSCHTTSLWKPATFNHTGVTAASNCATAGCHNVAGASPPIAGSPTGALAHTVAPMTSTSCGSCHTIGTSWGPGTKLNHTGVTNCSACHAYAGNGFTPAKANHVVTGQQCSICHTTTLWKPTFSHTGVTAATNCATAGCHNTPGQAVPVAGKPTSAALTHAVAPMSSTSCGTCHTIGTSWGPGTKMNHTGATTCSACHAYAGNGYTPAKANHVVTSLQCSTCHTTSLWKPAYSHAGVTASTNCATAGCHSVAGQAVPVAGRPSGAKAHTVAPMNSNSCATCHTIGGTWTGVSMNHTGVTSCTSCHITAGNVWTTPGKPDHIAIGTTQCSSCHTSTGWKPANYSHAGVTTATNCATAGCHNVAGKAMPGAGVSLTKPHTVAPMNKTTCGSCHTIGGASWVTTMNHSGVTNCSACHAYSGNGLTPTPAATHVGTSQQCSVCHTVAAWTPANSHNGVTTSTNCATAGCHSPAGKAAPAAGVSIVKPHTVAPMNSTSCAICHQIGTVWGPGTKMNHTAVTNCTACHAYTGNVYTTQKVGHVSTGQQCSICHTTTAWTPAYSHTGVTASTNCATAGCHGVAGQAVPVAGTPTGAKAHTVAPMNSTSCGSCHTIGGVWTGANMNHSGVTNCTACHVTGGNVWTTPGKANHITYAAGTQCSACHTTGAWLPAGFNHAGITAASNCATAGCHNVAGRAVPVAGTPTGALAHTVAPMTSTSCGSCHAIGTVWGPNTQMNHTGVTNCSACHMTAGNVWTTPGKPNHISFGTSQCSACHTTNAWTPASTFNHAANGITASSNCATAGCHNIPGQATPVAGTPTGAKAHTVAPMNSTSCGSCHGIGTIWTGAKMNHTGVSNCSACHVTGGNVWTTPGKPNHLTYSAGTQCSACHTTAGWLPAGYNHAGVTAATNCASAGCHNVPGQATPVAGTPTGAKAHTVAPMTSTSCGSCHAIGSVWTGANMNHTGVTNCTACHMTGGNVWTTPGKPTHITIGASQCSACHATASWLPASAFNHAANGITAATNCAQSGCHDVANAAVPKAGRPITGALAHAMAPMTSNTCATCHQIGTIWGPGTKMNHAGATSCTSCHAWTGNGFTPTKSNHMATTSQCSACHVTTGWLPAAYNHQGVTAATNCTQSGCHNVANATAPKAGQPITGTKAHTQAPMTSATCGSCHTIGTSWMPGTMNHSGLATCKQCHNYNGNGFTTAKANHIVTTAECNVCHTTTAWTPTSFAHTAAQVGTKLCKDCHNGTAATGPSTSPHNHAGISPAPYNCNACHRTTAWSPATFTHSGVTTGCANCHKLGFATAKSAAHFVTTQPCEKCHNTTAWSSLRSYVHTSAYYTSHSGFTNLSMTNKVDCLKCHIGNNEVISGAPNSPRGNAGYKPKCAWCHAGDYKIDKHKKTTSPTTIFYPLAEHLECGATCHEYTNNTFSTPKKTYPAGFHPNSKQF